MPQGCAITDLTPTPTRTFPSNGAEKQQLSLLMELLGLRPDESTTETRTTMAREPAAFTIIGNLPTPMRSQRSICPIRDEHRSTTYIGDSPLPQFCYCDQRSSIEHQQRSPFKDLFSGCISFIGNLRKNSVKWVKKSLKLEKKSAPDVSGIAGSLGSTYTYIGTDAEMGTDTALNAQLAVGCTTGALGSMNTDIEMGTNIKTDIDIEMGTYALGVDGITRALGSTNTYIETHTDMKANTNKETGTDVSRKLEKKFALGVGGIIGNLSSSNTYIETNTNMKTDINIEMGMNVPSGVGGITGNLGSTNTDIETDKDMKTDTYIKMGTDMSGKLGEKYVLVVGGIIGGLGSTDTYFKTDTNMNTENTNTNIQMGTNVTGKFGKKSALGVSGIIGALDSTDTYIETDTGMKMDKNIEMGTDMYMYSETVIDIQTDTNIESGTDYETVTDDTDTEMDSFF